jgi:hypothetical protein
VLVDCVFSGNLATYDNLAGGGGLYNYASSPSLTNCTFAGNHAVDAGGAMWSYDASSPSLANCILWGNTSGSGNGKQVVNYSGSGKCTLKLGYCDIQDGVAGIYNYNGATVVTTGSILMNNPLFVDCSRYNGIWSGNASFDSTRCQSTIPVAGAALTPGELAGKWVRPDPNQVFQYLVVGNGANTIAVWGDLSTNALGGKSFVVLDYHLQSVAGHWETGLQVWTDDPATSSCIDAGNPTSPYANEPMPNGGRVNLGAYGNTPEASKSSCQMPGGPFIYLDCRKVGAQLVLSWTNAACNLQSSPDMAGSYTNIPGATSPHTPPIGSDRLFFRLRKN